MNLLTQIQSDLIDQSANLPNTLRKAQVLARKLQSQELREWVNFELNGYPNYDVPEYRRFGLPLFGTFHGPMRSRMTGVAIPTAGLPEPAKEVAETLVVTEGVSAIEAMLLPDVTTSYKTLPMELTLLLRQSVKMTGGMELFEVYHQAPHYLFTGVLDSVKSRLLDLVLDLQQNDVTPEALSTGGSKQEMVRNSIINNIYGNNNNVATGQNVSQMVSIVQKGDIESLKNHLRAHNVDEDDLNELASAVAAEPQLHGAGFGSRVAGWIGTMVGKALSGAWQYAGDNAQRVLTEAVNGFLRYLTCRQH